jgi:hypothetical protein
MVGSSPPSLAAKVLELYVGPARSCIIFKDVSLGVHDVELPVILGSNFPKVLEVYLGSTMTGHPQVHSHEQKAMAYSGMYVSECQM